MLQIFQISQIHDVTPVLKKGDTTDIEIYRDLQAHFQTFLAFIKNKFLIKFYSWKPINRKYHNTKHALLAMIESYN